MAFNIIYADPPWEYKENGSGNRAIKAKYPTMSISELENMDIASIADDNCILFLWATFPRMQEAMRLFPAWGFEYKGLGFVWVKVNKCEQTRQQLLFPKERISLFWGMGYYTRQNVEVCLVGVKGRIESKANDIHSVVISEIQHHSKKPDHIRDLIVKAVGDLPRVELFARNSTPGWEIWGNEVDCSVAI